MIASFDDVPMVWGLICLLLACLGLVAAGLHDVAARTVPDRLSVGVGICGIGLALVQQRLAASAAAAALVLAVSVLLWLRGVMGGGDAKLLAAVALLVPPGTLPFLLAAVGVAGGLLSLVYLPGKLLFAAPASGSPASGSPASAGRAVGLLRRAWRCERRRLSRRGPLPYAVAIAAGALFTLAGV